MVFKASKSAVSLRSATEWMTSKEVATQFVVSKRLNRLLVIMVLMRKENFDGTYDTD